MLNIQTCNGGINLKNIFLEIIFFMSLCPFNSDIYQFFTCLSLMCMYFYGSVLLLQRGSKCMYELINTSTITSRLQTLYASDVNIF